MCTEQNVIRYWINLYKYILSVNPLNSFYLGSLLKFMVIPNALDDFLFVTIFNSYISKF